jgi:hypothetical protein
MNPTILIIVGIIVIIAYYYYNKSTTKPTSTTPTTTKPTPTKPTPTPTTPTPTTPTPTTPTPAPIIESNSSEANCKGIWSPSIKECRGCPEGSTKNGPGEKTGLGECNCIRVTDYWDSINLKCMGCQKGAILNGSGSATGANNCRCVSPNMYWDPAVQECRECPLGSNVAGTGDTTPFYTTIGPCKCNNNTMYFNGSVCVNCPPYSKLDGTGLGTNTPCKCIDRTYYWNGSACVKCPEGASLDGANSEYSVIPEHPGCKCIGPERYWKPKLGICAECPKDSYNVHVGHPNLNPPWNGDWVPLGHEPWTTPGQTPGMLCKCSFNMRWFHGEGCQMK